MKNRSKLQLTAKKVTVLIGLVVILGSFFVLSSIPLNRNSNSNVAINSTQPSTAISEDGTNSGIGRNLTANEYAQSTNTSIAVNLPDNKSGTYQMVSINTPPEWTGYSLFTSVAGVSDNITWERDGTIESPQSPWIYEELDMQNIDNTGTNPNENVWGFIDNSTTGTADGTALYMGLGYYSPTTSPADDDWMNASEYNAFNESLYLDRGEVSGVKVRLRYKTGQGDGTATFFARINGWQIDFPYLSTTGPTPWSTCEFEIPSVDIPKYFPKPTSASQPIGTISFAVGINERVSGWWEGTGTYNQNIWVDNISLYIRGSAKPRQVNLTINSTLVDGTGYGSGNLTLLGPWTNLSPTQYNPLYVNFTTGNSSDVKLTTNLTQYVNHTRFSQTFAGPLGSDFFVQNATPSNWTSFLYAATPLLHEQYNFTLYFPTDWNVWALYDPSPSPVYGLPGIDTSIPGRLGVQPIRANAFPGLWRVEFYSPNYVTALLTYRNTTISPGPLDWTPVDSLFAGDILNITAQVSGSESVTSTTAQLEIWFPNGTVWAEHSQEKPIDTSGMVYFDTFQIPLSGSDYVAGDYTAFVTWNNTRGATQCNETGIRSKIIPIRHLSHLEPDDPFMSGVINGTVKKIRVTYNDLLSGAPVTGATVAFLNFGGSIQYLTEIAPGYYSTDLLVAVTGESGYYNITVNASHTHFTPQSENITLDVVLDSSLTASIYPTIAVQSNENFTLELRYNQTGKALGIDAADIWISYDDEWTLTPGGEIGQYILAGNNSKFAANTIQKLEIGAQKLGYVPLNLSINVKIMPRTAVFSKIYMNGSDNTLLPKYEMNITTWLNLTVQFCDEVLGTPLLGSEVNITGVNATPSPLTPVGEYYEILLNSSALGKGVHFLTLIGNASNHVITTTVIQVTVDQLKTNIHTDDDKTTYYKLVGESITFKIRIDDLVFGGDITAYHISYEWRFGSGNLTGPDAEGYFTTQLSNLTQGTWTITIRVAGEGSDYVFDDLLVRVIVNVPVEPGIPDWVIYSIVGAIAAVIVIFALYETKFKYPPIIRDVRSLKSQVKRGKPLTVQVRGNDLPKALAGAYLAESKGALTSTQQELLKGQHIKPGKGAPVRREVTDITAPPPSESAAIETAPSPSVAPPQEPVKLAPEVPKPAAVTPTPTPAPAPVPAKLAEKPAAKPVTPAIAPIPEQILEFMKAKQASAEKPLPQVKTLPAVKSLPQIKELPAKPATKPAPKPEEKPAENAGDEKK